MFEYSLNDPDNVPWSTPYRVAPELLLRKLLALPSRPAVVMLHHYRRGRAGAGQGRAAAGTRGMPTRAAATPPHAHARGLRRRRALPPRPLPQLVALRGRLAPGRLVPAAAD